MVVVNIKTKVAHNPDCYIIGNIKVDNISHYESIRYAANDGYRLCKHCDPMQKLFRIKRTKMEKYCQKRDIVYTVENGDLIITTPYSEWKVFLKDDKYLLYHRNAAGHKKHYHLQTDKFTNLMDIALYIHRHDKFREKNPLEKPKKKTLPKQKKLKAPKMGKRGCNAKMRKHKEKQKAKDIGYVLRLIDSISEDNGDA